MSKEEVKIYTSDESHQALEIAFEIPMWPQFFRIQLLFQLLKEIKLLVLFLRLLHERPYAYWYLHSTSMLISVLPLPMIGGALGVPKSWAFREIYSLNRSAWNFWRLLFIKPLGIKLPNVDHRSWQLDISPQNHILTYIP